MPEEWPSVMRRYIGRPLTRCDDDVARIAEKKWIPKLRPKRMEEETGREKPKSSNGPIWEKNNYIYARLLCFGTLTFDLM